MLNHHSLYRKDASISFGCLECLSLTSCKLSVQNESLALATLWVMTVIPILQMGKLRQIAPC